jgi:thioesterase domain-containing protein
MSGDPAPLFVVLDGDIAASAPAWAKPFGAGLRVLSLDANSSGAPAVRTVEGRAAHLVRAIRAEQREGPYRLVGDGGGGAVAYEVARQLIGQRQAVEFLGLVRAPHPASGPANDGRAYRPAAMPIALHLFTESGDLGWGRCVPADTLHLQRLATAQPQELAAALQAALHCGSCAPASTAVRNVEEPFVVVQSGRGGSSPVLCFPGAGDHAGQFVELAVSLDEDRPVYALQHRGLDDGFVPASTVEAAAEHALLAAQRDLFARPVHLIGHSFGGWIAFELALRLAAANRPVASLTIIDSDPPNGLTIPEYTASEIFEEYARAVQLLTAEPIAFASESLERLGYDELLAELHRRMAGAGLLPPRSRPDILTGSLETFGAALRTPYLPSRPYGGPVAFVFADDPHVDAAVNAVRRDRAFAAWRAHAPRGETWHGPGNHLTILRRPHADDLARWWRSAPAA